MSTMSPMTMLFDKLGQILNQSYTVNLSVTQLMSQVCMIPHPCITEFMLNPLLFKPSAGYGLKFGVRTPYSILKDLACELVTKTVMLKNPKQHGKDSKNVATSKNINFSIFTSFFS